MKKNVFQKNNAHKGFVILFTILISAIILMMGLGIFSIATRETILSGTAREAQYAFYAADAGVECALYAESLPFGPFTVIGFGSQFNCGTGGLISVEGTGSSEIDPFMFNVIIGTAQGTSCAVVSVFSINAGAARRVISQGYNICNPDGTPAKNPILVERDLDTMYEIGPLVPISPLNSAPDPLASIKSTGSVGGGISPMGSLQQQIPVNTQKQIPVSIQQAPIVP